MKFLLLIATILSISSASKEERTLDLGNGESLTIAFSKSLQLEERDTPVDDMDVETWMKLVSDYDPTLVPDYTDHDCNTIREFEAGTLFPEYLNRNRATLWEEKDGKRQEFDKGSRWKDDIVKYNHAYGIPIVGQAHFTDDSLKRACYLVRFLLADNEGYRRMAYLSRMYIFGQKGGKCCPANMGNSALSCACALTTTFPIKQITTPSHEIGHWMLSHVFPAMVKTGYLKIPEFNATNNPEYKYTKPNGVCDDVVAEHLSKKVGDLYDFVWNSMEQSNGGQCAWQHYFMSLMHGDFLNLQSGGKPKEYNRKQGREQRPNTFKIFEQLWPCNNNYLSVCEDAAYGFTKGMAQRFVIGKSDPNDRSKTICRDDIDKPDIEEDQIQKLSPVPSEDESFARLDWEGIYKEDGFTRYQSGQDKCFKTIQKGGNMGYGWVKTNTKLGGIEKGNFYPEAIKDSLKDSNEFAWWHREGKFLPGSH